MYKKIFLLICSLILMLNLTSCGINDVLELDKNLRYVIEDVWGEDGLEGICYQDETYYIDRWNLFTVTNDSWNINEGDVQLSWNGSRFGYMKAFYSYTTEMPLFIYETANDDVFFHETYDYTADTFVIAGTNAEIVFSDIVSDLSKHENVNLQEDITIRLYSKNHPRIKMELDLECIEGQWYFRSALSGSSPTWTVSDSFVQILLDYGII
jgi:hypothetical protein